VSVVIKRPDPQHHCGPTRAGVWWEHHASGHYGPLHDPAGTIRACTDCGRTWVAMDPPPGLVPTVWRPEGRIERWWRMRRAPSFLDQTRREATP
jgi:hypothetical protein